MPTTKPAAPKLQTTDVLGYRNNNNFPISITSDNLGINTQVQKKSYVLDREGRKINDPRLDYYAKTGGLLSKEYSPTPVPVVLLASAPAAAASGAAGVSAPRSTPVKAVINSDVLPVSPSAAVALRSKIPAIQPASQSVSSPSSGSPSIHTMSVQDAVKSSLLPRPDRRDRFESAPNEDNDGSAARSAPFIHQIAPFNRPVVPKGLKLSTVDTTHVADLDVPDAFAAVTASVAGDAGVVLPPTISVAPAPVAAKTKTPKAKATAAPTVGVEYDGKIYASAGPLKKAIIARFNGDLALADEAYEPFKAKFAALRAAKS